MSICRKSVIIGNLVFSCFLLNLLVVLVVERKLHHLFRTRSSFCFCRSFCFLLAFFSFDTYRISVLTFRMNLTVVVVDINVVVFFHWRAPIVSYMFGSLPLCRRIVCLIIAFVGFIICFVSLTNELELEIMSHLCKCPITVNVSIVR